MKQWNIGNTTVRNPERIKDGLRLLHDRFVGQAFTDEVQDKYFEALLEAGIIKGNPAKSESRTQSARKWAAAFNQLGLAKCWQRKPPIEITDAGLALLNEATIDEDIYLRQMLKIQIPSPTESRINGAAIHPFYMVLRATYDLHELGLKGISKEEIALFLQTALKDSDAPFIIENIRDYRAKRESITGRVPKRRFYFETANAQITKIYSEDLAPRLAELSELIDAYPSDRHLLESKNAIEVLERITATGKGSRVQSAVNCRHRLIAAIKDFKPKEEVEQILTSHFLGRKINTLEDYADTTVRYSRITGIFTITGDKLAIKGDQLRLAEKILAQGIPPLLDDEEFLIKFRSSQYPVLPTEDLDFLRQDVASLIKKVEEFEERIGAGMLPSTALSNDILSLRRQRQNLENELLLRKEIEFYKSQRSQDQIDATKTLFESIANREIIGGSDYLPAWIEWAVWRVFLAINTIENPIHNTRNFSIDTDLNPIHHAKAGVADMVFEYPENFIMPTEVTLNLSDRQYSAEREPVQTHVLRTIEGSAKPVIGIFIAPTIDPRTAHEFFKDREGTYSAKLGRVVGLNIVPLTVGQLESLLPGEANGCDGSADLHRTLEQILDLASACSDGLQWLEAIKVRLGR